jgi:hypothetical protein
MDVSKLTDVAAQSSIVLLVVCLCRWTSARLYIRFLISVAPAGLLMMLHA